MLSTLVHAYGWLVWWIDAPYNREVPTWMAMIRAVMLCNKAEFRSGQESLPILKRSVQLWFPATDTFYLLADSAFMLFCGLFYWLQNYNYSRLTTQWLPVSPPLATWGRGSIGWRWSPSAIEVHAYVMRPWISGCFTWCACFPPLSPVPIYTIWWQVHMGVNNLLRVIMQAAPSASRTHDLLIISLASDQLHHQTILSL